MSLILIVDDDQSVRDELTSYIEDNGHEVLTAPDGQEGLYSAKNFAPDVIIIDSNMPVMGGVELIEKLRQAKETNELPLILMTDHETPKEKQRAQSLGVIDYLQKPLSKEDTQLRVKWALKAGSVVPAVPWDQSDSEAADDHDELDLDGPGAKKEDSSDPTQSRYKEEPDEAVKEVTPKRGGTVESKSGNVAVEIPPDSVPDTVGVMVKESDQAQKPDRDTLRLRLGDRATDVRVADQTGARIAGMQLKSPARIGIKVDPEDVAKGGKKRVLRVQEYIAETDSWREVATYVDEEEGVGYTRRDRLGHAPTENKGTVLFVETDEAEYPKEASALEGSGFTVERETVPSKVKDRIRREKPVIVILGFGIAGAAGSRLLREIKFDPDIRNVTVIPIAHPDDKEAHADAIAIGAREVVPGPVNMGEFQFLVNRAFEAISARRRHATAVKTRAGKADAKAWGESKSGPAPTPTPPPEGDRPRPGVATRGRRRPVRPQAGPGRRRAPGPQPARGGRPRPVRRKRVA
jgi:twitching motility two-component system response regulator PilH